MRSIEARRVYWPAIIGVLALGLGACGSSASSSSAQNQSQDKSPLNVAIVEPFSGPDAAFGPITSLGCFPAVALIQQAGGVLGHKTINCQTIDTRGDPADAVPAVRQMLTTTSDLVGIIGPSSDESAATVPIMEQADIPLFTNSGAREFDQTTNPYFHRLFAADDEAGYAMAAWGHAMGYTRAAAVFGNDVGSQGNVPTLLKAFKSLGGTIVSNETVTLDESSYQSEVSRMLASHPQVIFEEMDPQTAATFLSELQQLNGSLIPVIGADTTLQPTWFQAVGPAIGKSALSKYVTAEVQFTPPSGGAAYNAYKPAMLAVAKTVKGISDPASFVTSPAVETIYDQVTVLALAMIAAQSTDPKVFDPYIDKLLRPSADAVKVGTFAAGKTALEQHKTIQYVGVQGPYDLNTYNNLPPDFQVDSWTSSGALHLVGSITPAQINAAAHG